MGCAGSAKDVCHGIKVFLCLKISENNLFITLLKIYVNQSRNINKL